MKHHEPGFSGQPDNSCSPAFAAGAVTANDETTQRQVWLGKVGFHHRRIDCARGSLPLGIPPMRCFYTSSKVGRKAGGFAEVDSLPGGVDFDHDPLNASY